MKTAKRRNILKITVRLRFWFDQKARRIALRHGQQVVFQSSRTTDEGWSSEKAVLSLRGRTLHMNWVNDGRDCDGRLTQYGHAICPVSDRARHKPGRYGSEKASRNRFPVWKTQESRQHDEYAEMMGY